MALYRGGTDESTFGPHFTMNESHVTNVGNGTNKSAPPFFCTEQVTEIAENTVIKSAQL